MTADGREHRILVGNRILDGSFLEHIPSDNGEADMLSGDFSRIAREGRDVVSLIQGLFNQASTGGPSSPKDHNMHNAFLPVPSFCVAPAPQRWWLRLQRSARCCSHHARRVVVGAPRI